jgi:hypothetical protein
MMMKKKFYFLQTVFLIDRVDATINHLDVYIHETDASIAKMIDGFIFSHHKSG